MCEVPSIDGLAELWARTRGDPDVRIAVIDGRVDLDHRTFAGARISALDEVWPASDLNDAQARHGTHVASVLFGQHDGPVKGVAPECTGITIPVFSGERKRVSQVDLARGIEQAVEHGAHVINVSAGQFSESGEPDDLLRQAARLCEDSGVLLVAAAGNNGCLCAHVPAAVSSVLAVGALDDAGAPLESSNWGAEYRTHGILAPGENILGAVPGGGTTLSTGTSLATPIVSGVAALLLSLQLKHGHKPDPLAVRDILLAGADPCDVEDEQVCQRLLTGKLNVRRATRMTAENIDNTESTTSGAVLACAPSASEQSAAPSCSCTDSPPTETAATSGPIPMTVASGVQPATRSHSATLQSHAAAPTPQAAPAGRGVVQSDQPPAISVWQPYVYALGTLGYDFGTEARRDSFKQLMPAVTIGGSTVPANPYDARQMVDHLNAHASEARSLIWTLNLELTPIYAIEPVGPYAAEVYALLTALLGGEIADAQAENYIERISVPGRQTDRTARLFSGQTVPVVEVDQVRGLNGWEVNRLLSAATDAAQAAPGEVADETVHATMREFLTKVYYDLRNLGATSHDRALNFAATNAFQAAHTFATAVAAGMALDTIGVERSPFGRIDSDCWDVKLRFFDPENSRRAKKVFRFSIDVSDCLPVTLGEVRTWSEA